MLYRKALNLQKIENTCTLEEKKNKKALVLFDNRSQKRIISEKRKIKKENDSGSGMTDDSSKNARLKSNNSFKTIKIKHVINGSETHSNNAKNKDISSRIPISGPNKKRKNEIPITKKEKNFRKEKIQKLDLHSDNMKKLHKQNSSFNQKMPKLMPTDNNNIIHNHENKKMVNNKINNYLSENNQLLKNNQNNQNGSYTKINKNKVNIINTGETQKKNNIGLIRNKTNENYNQSKENKSNISNYDKRKNYNVPKVKKKLKIMEKEERTETNEENEEEKENEKEKLKAQLFQNAQDNYLRVFQKQVQEDSQSKKNLHYENKRKIIQEIGINIDDFLDDDEEDDKSQIKKEIEKYEKIEMSSNKKNKKEKEENKKLTKSNNMQREIKDRKNSDENKNINFEIKKINNESKQKSNVHRNIHNNNLQIQNNSNSNNSDTKNNYLMLHNDNINMNLSGSTEKNNDNNNMVNNQMNNKYYNKKYEDINNIYDLYNNNKKEKEKRKQNVDTLEFYTKIANYLDNEKLKKEYYDENIPNSNNNDSLGESFRKSFNNSKKNDNNNIDKNNKKNVKIKYNNNNLKNIEINNNNLIKADSINNENENENDVQEILTESDSGYSGFNYDSKKNKRKKEEIQEFMERKKKKRKDEDDKNIKDSQAKQLNKYYELCKLQQGIKTNNNLNRNRSKINLTDNNTENISNIDYKNLKGKMPNEYFIGKNNSSRRKNSDLSKSTDSSQSTIYDQNNFYLNVITSKNIFSKNYPNSIDNDILNKNEREVMEEGNNNNNNNIINCDSSNNIQLTTKDKDIQNTYNINTNTSNNNRISQEMNEKSKNEMNISENKNLLNGDLFIKCKETLEKANQIFSKPKLEEMLNNYCKSNYDDDKNFEEMNNFYENFRKINNLQKKECIDNNIQVINEQMNKSESKVNKSIFDSEQKNFNNIDNKNNMIQGEINNINDNLENKIVSNINSNSSLNMIQNNGDNEIGIEDLLPKEYNKNNNNENNVNINENNDINNMVENNKEYCFSQEDLENYYKIFVSLEDYLNSLSKKNALNDIINYGNLRFIYKAGFERIVFFIKSYPYNLLRLIYQRQYNKEILRQLFMPYLRRAFSNINIYGYYKQKFSEINSVFEQIYKIIFLKRLSFYGQVRQMLINQSLIENSNNKIDENVSTNNNSMIINKETNHKTEKEMKDKEKEKDNSIVINKEKLLIFIKILNLFFKKYIFIKLFEYYVSLVNQINQNENQNENENANVNATVNESNYSSQKYNTFIYESFSENSSLTAYPNSENNDRLHKVCELLGMQRKQQSEEKNHNLNEFDYRNLLEMANNSIQSIKSVEEEKNKKINIKNNLNLSNINNFNNKINDINNVNSEKNISLNELIKSNDNLNEHKQNKVEENKKEEIANINNMNDMNDANKINNKIVEEKVEILNEQRMKNKTTFNKIQESFNIEIENNNLNNLDNIIGGNNINNNLSFKGNFSNENISNLKLNNNNNEEIEYIVKNDKINIEVNYGNMPKKAEKEQQYKKIEIKTEGSQNGHQNSGCIKKIEVANNFKLNMINMNGQHDNSSSKDSNLIDWEFNNTNNSNSNSNIIFQYNKINIIDDDKNVNNEIYLDNKGSNKSLSNRNKSPLSNNLQKDDLFNSSEFNSNINDGIIEEKDINLNEPERNDGSNDKTNINNNNNYNISSNNNSNKDLSELNDKKSRNSNDNSTKEDVKENKESNLINNSNNDSNNKQTNNSSNLLKSFEDNNYNINLNLSNSFINNKNNNNNASTLSNNSGISNNNLRYNQNNNSEINNPNLNKENLNDIKITLINENNTPNKIFSELSDDIMNKITNDLCEQIISNILISEIKDKKKVLFKKKKGINTSLNNSSASLRISQNSMSLGSHSPGRNYPVNKNMNLVNNNDSYQTISSANNSQSEAILNNSIFMMTIDEIKKEKTLNLYNDKIAPLLIEKIEENIGQNYEKIINNLKIPHKIDEAKMINGLMLKDRNLSITSKIRFCNDDIMKNKFVEENILNDFEKIDKEIRNNDNIVSDNYYDKILNKCVFDTTNELIEKRRQYGIIGQPLSWSIRTRDIDFKYKNNDKYSKSLFTQTIIKEVKKIIDTKMGLIAENYEYLDMDQLNQDRDKKFMDSILKELKDDEDYYQIFETQETYVKLSLSRIIMDQLLNEIVEILEHVQYSRKEPDKYQSKSIYACEDIPRLSFQPQTMENNYTGNYEGDAEGDESINQ